MPLSPRFQVFPAFAFALILLCSGSLFISSRTLRNVLVSTYLVVYTILSVLDPSLSPNRIFPQITSPLRAISPFCSSGTISPTGDCYPLNITQTSSVRGSFPSLHCRFTSSTDNSSWVAFRSHQLRRLCVRLHRSNWVAHPESPPVISPLLAIFALPLEWHHRTIVVCGSSSCHKWPQPTWTQ